MKRRRKESHVQSEIIEYLSFLAARKDLLFFSVPNESLLMVCVAFGIPKTAIFKLLSFLRKMGMTNGVADIVMVYEGNAFFLEVKKPTGKQSSDQKSFEAWANKCGAKYSIVRSLDECRLVLEYWGIG